MLKKHKIWLTVALCLCVAVLLYAVGVPWVQYRTGLQALRQEDYGKAYRSLAAAGDYADAKEKILESKYSRAKAYIEQKDYRAAARLLVECAGYRDANDLFFTQYANLGYRNTLAAGGAHAVAITAQGAFTAAGNTRGYYSPDPNQKFALVDQTANWKNIVDIAAGERFTIGLQSNGQTLYAGAGIADYIYHSEWKDLVTVAAGRAHVIALRSDGTLRFLGENDHGQCSRWMLDWKNIVAIAAGENFSLGLQSDGTLKVAGDTTIDVSGWSGITDVAAGYGHIVGITEQRKVVATGDNFAGQCDVADWGNIIDVAAGRFHTVGLRANGRVYAVGENFSGQCDVADWQDVVAIAAGNDFTLGVTSDGTVLFTGNATSGQGDATGWTGIQTTGTAGAIWCP